jgi:hypothetical protein
VLVAVAGYARVEEEVPAAYLFSYDLLTDIALVAAAIAPGVSARSRRKARAQEQVRVLIAAEERREADRRRRGPASPALGIRAGASWSGAAGACRSLAVQRAARVMACMARAQYAAPAAREAATARAGLAGASQG